MNRTYTPELNPDVLDRLAAYAAGFRDDFNRPRQAAWCGVYLRGLIQDGDRKSVEPMAARVPLPEGLDVADPDQALQQFLGQSTWDEQAVLRRYRAAMAAKFADPAGIFVIDDTTFPKQGKHSVGVQRQYCGALGKKANCQCAVCGPLRRPEGPLPAGHAALPPGELAGRPERLDKAERARGRAAAADQGRDRAGVARPGPRRGAARPGGRGRRGLRRLGAVPRRAGRARPALHRRA